MCNIPIGITFSESGTSTIIFNYKLINVLPCNKQCGAPKVGMLPKALAEVNIPTRGTTFMLHVYDI